MCIINRIAFVSGCTCLHFRNLMDLRDVDVRMFSPVVFVIRLPLFGS